MNNATPGLWPEPSPSQRSRPSRYRLRIWRCGLCNTLCKTVLAPGGLCSLCRRQSSLPGVDDLPSIGGEQ